MSVVRRQQQNRRGGGGGGGSHVGTLQVSLYQCGQNHIGRLQVSLSLWAESRQDTTGVAINVGRITSGHYRCHCRDTTGVAVKCGLNYVEALQVSLSMWAGSLQVSLSMWAESRRDTTNGAIAVDHPSSRNRGSDEKTREESRVIAGRNRCYGTQPTMSAVGVTGVHMHEEQIAP